MAPLLDYFTALMTYVWSTMVNLLVGKADESHVASPLQTTSIGKISDGYDQLYEQNSHNEKEKLVERKEKYAHLVNSYYDMVTDFYEWGWGESFHFGPRFAHEGFDESIARHEYWLAAQLGLREGQKVLDVGCGIGGPMRNIARFCSSTIVGVNNNAYQVQRGTLLNKKQGLSHLCSLVKGDFMNLAEQFGENSFDQIYTIEATCHAPDKKAAFAEIFKVVKPGGRFAGYEWVVTDKYDKNNPEHRRIKYGIEKGDALPELATMKEVVDSLIAAGFEVESFVDCAQTCKKTGQNYPWYGVLNDYVSLRTIHQSKYGRFVTRNILKVLSMLKIAPKGVAETQTTLDTAADNLVLGGQQEIFTPMFFFLARKPDN